MRPNHPYRFAQNGGEFLHKLIRHVPKVPEGKPDLAESPGRLRNIIPDVKTFSAGRAGNRRIAFAAKPFSRHIVKLFPDIFSAARTDGRLKTSFQIGKNIFSVKLFDTESVYGEAAFSIIHEVILFSICSRSAAAMNILSGTKVVLLSPICFPPSSINIPS